jgi:hypothetical protein
VETPKALFCENCLTATDANEDENVAARTDENESGVAQAVGSRSHSCPDLQESIALTSVADDGDGRDAATPIQRAAERDRHDVNSTIATVSTASTVVIEKVVVDPDRVVVALTGDGDLVCSLTKVPTDRDPVLVERLAGDGDVGIGTVDAYRH